MIKLCAPTDAAGNNIDESIKAMRNMGVHLAEVRYIGDKSAIELSVSEAESCYNKFKEKGIEVYAIATSIGKRDFSIDFEEFKKRVYKAVEIAKAFHASYIRVFSFLNHNNNVDEVVNRLKSAVEIAGKENIKICIENKEGAYGCTAQTVGELLDKVPGLLTVYDPLNYIRQGETSESSLSIFARANYVHFNDAIRNGNVVEAVPAGEGIGSLAKLIQMTTNRDMPFSVDHHLRFPQPGETFEELQGKQKFVYPNKMAAFFDAVGHMRMLLLRAGYMEIHEGLFKK
ncbi:MAG: sugar phosphate isomerase/epimerase [Bacilli bacterium]|nr:sugar phosphate isomerase/epimerase [Bacilli bacterium]